jgi:hypothetical protein
MKGYAGPGGRARDQANEELVERGMEGLCNGVDHIVKGNLKHDNVTGYLALWIEGAMYRPDDGLIECLPEDLRSSGRVGHLLDARFLRPILSWPCRHCT